MKVERLLAATLDKVLGPIPSFLRDAVVAATFWAVIIAGVILFGWLADLLAGAFA